MAFGISGKLNHMLGVRAAGTILAINPDAQAPHLRRQRTVIVAERKTAVPLLRKALRERMEHTLTPVVGGDRTMRVGRAPPGYSSLDVLLPTIEGIETLRTNLARGRTRDVDLTRRRPVTMLVERSLHW
jgi:hypothetical protein